MTPPAHDDRPASDASDGSRRIAVVRFSGDVTTKAGPTRRRFVQRLHRNLKDALETEGVPARLERTHNRLFAELDRPEGVDAMRRVFGAQSLSLAVRRPWSTLDDLVASGVELFADAVVGKRFAVRAKRVGERKRIEVKSKDVEFALGTALIDRAAGVDLKNPEVAVRIEIMPGHAYFFQENVAGQGGLPLGVEGNAVSLVSGGFDSAVASWLMQKRGVSLDFVFCNLGGEAHQLETLRVMKVIADRWSYGTRPHLHAIDFDAVTRDLQAKVTTRYWQIILKRLFLRAAERIAQERTAAAIVTGEAVGQVSSQTLQNLAVIDVATPVPVLRPLVAFNKDEIVALSREIGTYELSSQVGEYCAMVPSKPATAAQLPVIEAEDAKLDASLLETAVEERAIFDLRRLDLASIDSPDLDVDRIAPGATVIDLRSKAAYQSWHYPDALFLDFQSAVRAFKHFNTKGPFVLYCEFGLKSAHLAEMMRAAGLEAYHVRRGLRGVIDLARREGVATP